jgi:hypothetical protein
MPSSPHDLSLAFGLRFEDLYERQGLETLDSRFLARLREADGTAAERLLAARADPSSLAVRDEAEMLIAIAPHVDRFVAELFGIVEQWEALVEGHHRLAPLFRVKRKFVQRRAMLKIKADEAATLDGPALEAQVTALLGHPFEELRFAESVLAWMADEANHTAELALAERFAAWAAHTPEGRRAHRTVSSSSHRNGSIP